VRCWERWLSPVRRRVTAHVRSVRHSRVRCLVVLCCHPLLRCHSTLRWYIFVCQQLSEARGDSDVRSFSHFLFDVRSFSHTTPVFFSKKRGVEKNPTYDIRAQTLFKSRSKPHNRWRHDSAVNRGQRAQRDDICASVNGHQRPTPSH